MASEFQEWADGNRNGMLEPPELREVLEAVRALIQEPHPVRTPVDEFFNLDGDGEISPKEMIAARNFIFREQLRRIYQYDPDLARLFNLNNDEWISLGEIEPFMDLLFIPETREPREAMGPLERRADRNRDGFVDEGEFEDFARQIFAIAALLPLAPEEGRQRAVGKRGIFAYVDVSENGRLEPQEEGDLTFMVAETVAATPGRPAQNPVDHYFDRNGDGRLDLSEIEEARVQFMEAVIARIFEADPEVAREYIDRNKNNRIDFNGNGRIEEIEIIRARRAGNVITEERKEAARVFSGGNTYRRSARS